VNRGSRPIIPSVRDSNEVILNFSIIFLLTFSLFASACRKEEKDPRIEEVQKDVRLLLQENQKLRQEVQSLHHDMENRSPVQTATAEAPGSAPKQDEMTVEKMKVELQPSLLDLINRIKSTAETPAKGTQFGLRQEYNLKKAVYGLVRTDDPITPYQAKVIVPYEKYLESDSVSRSYGTGSTTFIFVHRGGQWFLHTYE